MMDKDNAPYCGQCGSRMVLKETSRYQYADGTNRKFWGCVRYPECSGTVGSNANGKALGIPGSGPTKKYRIEAHKALERRLRGSAKGIFRGDLYRTLAKEMKIDPQECHIGMFNIEQCKKAIRIFGYDVPKIEVDQKEKAFNDSEVTEEVLEAVG